MAGWRWAPRQLWNHFQRGGRLGGCWTVSGDLSLDQGPGASGGENHWWGNLYGVHLQSLKLVWTFWGCWARGFPLISWQFCCLTEGGHVGMSCCFIFMSWSLIMTFLIKFTLIRHIRVFTTLSLYFILTNSLNRWDNFSLSNSFYLEIVCFLSDHSRTWLHSSFLVSESKFCPIPEVWFTKVKCTTPLRLTFLYL